MDWIVLTGTAHDGRWPFDFERELTTREWGWVKRFSGYLPTNWDEGFKNVDPELHAAFAVIALHRAGKVRTADVPDTFDRLLDAPFGSGVRLELGQAEVGDAGPPPSSESANGNTSGAGSQTSSEAPTEILPPSGTPGSATSPSDPKMSVT